MELERRLRRVVRERARVTIDERVEEPSVEDDVARAQREIASSTTAATAVNLPPNKDELEDEEGAITDMGVDGLGGGSPLKMSSSSSSWPSVTVEGSESLRGWSGESG